MRTLEELIESMLLVSEVNRQYREENADVLHYLRCYQDCLKQMENNQMIIEDAVRQRDAHIKALAEMKRNDPLTWDELIEMQGKPVWVECKFYSHQWAIIGEVTENRIRFYGHRLVDGEPQEEMGETWQAYRKERKSDTSRSN